MTMAHSKSADSTREGMTIRELKDFLELSLLSGHDPESSPRVDIGFKGQIKNITVKS